MAAATRYAEYVAAEAASDVKHEYLRGEIFAMAGGTPEHGRLAANVIREIGKALGSRPRVVFTSDVRVRIYATDRATYPDVSVICGAIEKAPDDPDAIVNPVVIVEVLSDSTEASDRGEKFAHYRHLASLREYVLVSQQAARIEVYRREERGWVLSEAGPGGAVRLASLDMNLSVDEVYRNPLASTQTAV
jgi:Uma2 family endonuclease